MRVTIELSPDEIEALRSFNYRRDALGYISSVFPKQTIYVKVADAIKEAKQ